MEEKVKDLDIFKIKVERHIKKNGINVDKIE